MSRIETREIAVTSIYQSGFRSESIDDQIELFIGMNPIIEDDKDYFESLVRGVLSNKASLDEKISQYLVNWKLDRLPKVDVAILEAAFYEILNMDDIATNVTISEAVKLAKKYGTDKSSSYINGVLSTFEKSL